MDDGPPPFVVPPPEDDEEERAPFDSSFDDIDGPLNALKLPSVSRSPSPSPIPKVNGVSHDEKENDFDVPPPIKIETHTLRKSKSPRFITFISDSSSLPSLPNGGIESFLEREAIRSEALPVHCIGLSPVVSREPSPCPERGEAPPNGFDRVDHTDPPREERPIDQPLEEVCYYLSTVTEEDDDWAALQSSSAVSQRKESVTVDDDDDWAAFEAAAPATERLPSLDDEDDWATDFASAPPPTAAAAAPPAVEKDELWDYGIARLRYLQVPSLPSLADLSIDEGIWSATEGTVEDEEEEDGFAFDLYARLDAEDPRAVKGTEGGKRGEEEEGLLVSASLWLALRVVEEAAALRHTWEGSRAAKQLYDLLDINTARPMQRAQLAAAAAVPSPDAILQPTKIGEMNGKSARAVTLSSTSNSSISYATSSASTTSTGGGGGTTSASTSLGSGCLVPSTSSQSISPVVCSPAAVDFNAPPPVEFDWEKSALKTPAMQQASAAMLDMDYFAAGGGPPKIISSDSTLQNTLDAFGLSATTASAGMPRVESTPSVLDTILSSTRARPSPRYLAPAELSLDARALHDALPSLDHLAASWIAFPVRDNGDS
ncbi:hypothetical protein PRIPAC_73449 [Pristionchus pacificus]|uniref:Uncharacterized protein n=1 Tax=Pristionchus pacificus TaxID=54126 RepID=A0A2A6C0E2_PRIPA|nr:hypothetical protein PRIPAC_73449 [Pristionchus pacificus]|eukprot:PDM71610.1 hypothetical protein PRIPAC_38017 [Pristionchus pacificus]